MADYLIELGVKLNTKNIDTEISGYNKLKKVIKVKSDLDTSGITKALNSYKAKNIDVGVKLNTTGITEAIRSYKPSKKIHIDSKLNTADINKQLNNFRPTKQLKVNVELNKSSINQQIASANPRQSIKINAKLDSNAINTAITNYKQKSPLVIRVKPDFTKLKNDLSNYKAKQLKIGVNLNKTAINEQINQYNQSLKSGGGKKVTLGVRITNKAIADAINDYGANHADKLKLPITLTFGANSDFDTKLNNKINEYQKNPLPVKAQLVPAKNFDSNITKTPIKIHATLIPDEINDVIDYYTPKSKIKVGVKLNPTDVNTEIKNLPKSTQPLEVDVALTQSSINKAITNTKSTSLLKVGVDLQESDINSQIEKMHPTSKVKVYLDLDDNINEEAKKQSGQTPININVKLDRDDINKQIKEFKTASKMKVGVKLDFASHDGGQKGVPQQIKDYKTSAKIKVGAKLDEDSVSQSIQGLTVNAPVPIKIELEQNSVKNVKSQIDNLRQQIQSLGNVSINLGGGSGGTTSGGGRGGVGSKITKAATAKQRALRSTYKLYKDIESMELKLGELGKSGIDSSEIVNYRAQLNELRTTYENLLSTLSGQNGAINLKKVSTEIDEAKTSVAELSSQIDNARTKLAKDIKIDIKNGELNNQIESVRKKFNQLGVENQQVENEIKELQSLLKNMDASDDIESVTKDYQDFVQVLQTVNNRVDGLKMDMDEANRPEILNAKKEEAMQRLNGLFDEGSQASKRFGEKAEELRRELNQVGNVKGVDIVNKKIKNLGTEIKNSHVQTKTLGVRLKEQLSRYSNYLSIASVFMYGTQAMRSMFEQVKLIDSAMTELKKVTDETDASYNRFLDNAATRAKELGTTIDGLVSSTADFARLGYSFSDSQGLAEVANIYAVVGDEVEGVEGATESLISTMAAFKDQANGLSNTDFGMEIIDKFNKIGNEFAISSGGIGEAMKRSASSLDAANNTIDESIALITAANTVVQNPDKVGNAFKTISMRIRGAKTELEEAGESTEGMAESTATMRKEIMALSGVDIMLDNSTFKSTYQVMDELSKKWKDLTDIQQASIIELMAGKHQGNVFASLMANFDIARDALVASEKASGSAMAEHAKWSESLEARLLRLKAAWQSLSQSFMNSDFLKIVIESAIKLIDVLDKLISNFGTLGTIGISTGLINIFRNKDLVSNVSKFTKILFGSTTTFEELWNASDKASDSIKSFTKSAAGVATGVGIAVAAISLIYNQYANMKQAAAEARQEAIETADAFLDSAGSFEQAYIKYSGRTDLTAEEEAELTSAIQGTVNALDDKSSALQNIVDNSNDYLASLEMIKNAELDAAYNAANKKKQESEELLKEAAIGWSTVDGSEVNVDLGTNKDSEAVKIAREMDSAFTSIKKVKGYLESTSFTLSADADTGEIMEYYNSLLDYQEALVDADLVDTTQYEQVTAAIDKMTESLGTYVEGLYEYEKAKYQLDNGIPKTTEDYIKMRESILRSEEIEILSLKEKMNVLNSLDSEYKQAFDLSSIEAQARKFVGIIEGYGDGTKDGTNEIGTVETFLNMRTAVNNDECTVAQYLSEFDNITSIAENFSEEERKEFNLAFGLDVDSIKKQYEDVYNYIYRNYLNNIDTAGMSWFDGQEYKDSERKRIQELLKGLTASELKAVANIKGEINWETTNTDEIIKQIKDEAALIEALSFTIDIKANKESLDALNTALTESKSAAGLTAESIESLKSRYQELDSYDAASLFEETASGIRVNSTELAKLEKEYKDFNKQEIDDTLKTLTEEYNKLTDEIANCTDDQDKLNDLYDERSAILDQINNVASLAAQYEGLTSAYNEWQRAKEAGQDRDPYENVLSGREEIEEEMSRGWLDDAAVEYLELLSGKDLSTAGIDAQIAAYKELDETIGKAGYSIWDFFTKDEDGNSTSDGVYNFFDTVKSVAGETAAWVDENGKYNFDFEGFEYEGETGDAAIAKMLGTSEELVQIILRAAEDAGFIINIEGDYTDLADAVNEAEKANDRMKELGATTYTFNFDTTNVESLNEQIGEAKTMLSNLKNEDGTLKVGVSEEDYRQARDIIYSLILQKQRLDDSAILHVDTEQAQTDIEIAISKLQEFKTSANTLEVKTAVGADTSEVTSDIQSVLEEINGLDANIKAGLGLDTEEVQTAIGNIQANINAKVAISQEDIDVVNTAISSISNDAMVSLGLDTTLIDNYKQVEQEANGVVNWDNNIEKVTTWINQKHEASGTVKWDDDTSKLKTTYTGKGVVYWDTEQANGTANANGTAQSGRSFAKGDWGIKGSGTALVGELGTEVLVRNGQYYTIGDNGAEFVKYRQGDIIFNHKQTEELFKNGRVTSGGGRGKMFANGSAFSNGGGASGSIRDDVRDGVKDAYKEINSGSNGSDGSKRNTIKNAVKDTKDSKDSKDTKDTKEEFKETIDWVEIAIQRIEREIDKLDQKANSVYQSWGSRNSALTDQINEVGNEIELQQDAYARYMQEANSVGLSEPYASQVRNGTIDISTIKDEALAEKIKDYQTWYEKAIACKDEIDALKETESELYAQRFENVQAQYDGILQGYEHTETMLNEYISQAEAKGHIVSKEYYQAIAKNETAKISELKKEQSDLLAARESYYNEMRSKGMSDKEIRDSEKWIEMCNDIDSVTESIEECNTNLEETANKMREVDWSVFDLTQERMSAVNDEADFLIELMSNDKLHEDNGKLTGKGAATMGLHAQKHNTYMYQADEYGAEVAKLDKQIAKDPYDQELINRRDELLGLQRESILAAEDEKQAIKDLVEDGINKELDSLQELIDKKNEELESEKDLYDYQKKVKEQTEEIASIEKQMAAYSGDDSEEAKSKVQELKVSLEDAKEELKETEWDKYISDTSTLLDSLYTEYETILNARLDNVDYLLQQVVDGINASMGSEGAIATSLGAEGAIAQSIVNAVGENGSIKNILNTEATTVGSTLSNAMNSIWTTEGTGTNSILSTYGKDFQDKQTTVNTTLGDIKVEVNKMVSALNKEAEDKVKQPKTKPSTKADPTGGKNEPSKPSKTTDKPSKPSSSGGDGKAKVGDKVKFVSGQYYYDSQGKAPLGSKYQGKQVYITKINKEKWATHPYHISTGSKLGKGDLGWLKLNQLSGYASGKKNLSKDELAWTQEQLKKEFIVRPSDGAILTPVAKGDSVLNAQASRNIWDMANSPADFIKNNLNLGGADIPNNSNVQNYTQHFNNTLNFPNVKSYEEMLSALSKDPKFDKLINAMTADRYMGKSSLAKGKAIR